MYLAARHNAVNLVQRDAFIADILRAYAGNQDIEVKFVKGFQIGHFVFQLKPELTFHFISFEFEAFLNAA